MPEGHSGKIEMLYTLLIKGYEVVGVDYAKTAFSRCQAYIEQNGLTMKSYTSERVCEHS